MSDPDRIWLQAYGQYSHARREDNAPSDEYIRADAVAEMIRQAVADATGLHLVIAAIREATVGGKPMLSDLPAALLEWRQQAVQAEREACARIVSVQARPFTEAKNGECQNKQLIESVEAALLSIAAAIRARGDT